MPTARSYGSPEYSTDKIPILDPKTNTVTHLQGAGADPKCRNPSGPAHAAIDQAGRAIAVLGRREHLGQPGERSQSDVRQAKGRVWYAARVRATDNPAFCKRGSSHPSAKAFPSRRSGRQVAMLDPKTMKYTFVDTCYGTHHLQFATMPTTCCGPAVPVQVAGWVDTKMFDETGDAAKSQGWSPFILDTNGNGKRDEYVEPNQPMDAARTSASPAAPDPTR